MSDFLSDVPLRSLNTFGVPAQADRFLSITSEEDLTQLFKQIREPVFILGGGSNILLTGDVQLPVLKMEIRQRTIVEEGDKPLVVAGAGENWHEFTSWTLDNGLGGLENLSLIPGTVGAAPIQNIGAYGVELADVFDSLEAVDRSNGERLHFTKDQCRFGYRDSIFKGAWRDKLVITRVWFRLHRDINLVQTGYGAIKEELEQMEIIQPTVCDVAAAVIRIRRSKLPDPAKLGNAGSFFKNPVIKQSQAEELKKKFPDLVSYPAGKGLTKIPAGWLIEFCGWKGRRLGDAGCYEKQALVLVNYGNATGEEIQELSKMIMRDVAEKFGIRLSTEVNIV